MIHYNVWFTLKDGIDEGVGLSAVSEFLRGLSASGELGGFQLLRNKSEGVRTKLPRYQALIEFSDEDALANAMKKQATAGIHRGGHGRLIDVVNEFRVEVFSVLTEPFSSFQYACEI